MINNMIRKIKNKVFGYAIILAAVIQAFSGCEEAKRFELGGDDKTPPAAPVFLSSTPLSGGARIFYQPPVDEDLLFVEASYINASGKPVRFLSSLFADSVDVLGFDREGEHTVTLCAADRAGNRSSAVTQTVVSLEPAVVSVAKSVRVHPSFSSMIVKWQDLLQQNVYVFVNYAYSLAGQNYTDTIVFASYNSEARTIDSLNLYNSEPMSVKVTVKDKYGNTAPSIDTVITLLTDKIIDKTLWSLPAYGTVMGGVTQNNGSENGGDMDKLIDGLTEETDAKNFYLTTAVNPWNIIIDLGEKRELSRIVTYQRYSYTDDTERGAFYRGDNVLSYNMYIWDEATQAWEFVSRHDIPVPVVKQESEYVTLGYAGDEAFLYPDEPQFSKPARYFRFEALNGKSISEITLYGK
jgi:hypothetical protein